VRKQKPWQSTAPVKTPSKGKEKEKGKEEKT
jgi:hypothetical protein